MNNQEMGFVDCIIQNLPNLTSEEVQWWIEHPRELKKLLAQLCRSTEPSLLPTPFRVWKTIRLGTGLKTADDFRRAIRGDGKKISDWANDILGQPEFIVADAPIEVRLVNVSAAELGLTNGGTRKQIYDRALRRGLKLCSPEVGPQLRLQYTDQPLNEWILVGMKPIARFEGNLSVFDVERVEVGLLLFSTHGHPEAVWDADVRWVFAV